MAFAKFDEYVTARAPGLLRLAAVLAGDRGVAEDVVQEVLLRASARWASIATLDVPDAYVRRMVVNEYASWRRKWARLVPRAEITDARVEPDHADRSADHDELARQLDRLPRKQRIVLVLRYYESLADEDIATALGCTTGTVRSHASRALATLRIDLTAERTAVPLRKET